MRDYISIGSSPSEEPCAQVGTDNYPTQSSRECLVFKHQLERMFPNPPEGAYLSVKAFPHDFGTYREVVCYYDDEDDGEESSQSYALKLERETPSNWDDEAKKELGIN